VSGLETVLLGTAVALGALTQRATGLGLALVAAPFLVLVAGPVDGVSLSNTLSASLCALVLARTWRRALWRQVALLGLSALIGIPLGVVVVRTLPDGPLLVAIGTLSIAAVLVAALAQGRDLLPGRRSAVLAGALGGFMNATAGVGGPMISAYGVSRRWELPEFIPTVQGTLLVVNLASIAGKGLPSLDPAVWLVCGAALVIGLVAGELVGGRLGAARGRQVVIAVALAGGIAAVVRGTAVLAG
jgi:uncharacterized protein